MDLKEVQVESNGGVPDEVDAASDDNKRTSDILYGIDDIPPWYLSIPMAFQVKHELFRL